MMETLHSIGITDSMITSSVITIILCVIAIVGSRRLEMIPSGLQNVLELAVEKLHGFLEDIMGSYACKKYFALVATLFVYILICNYSGLLPLFGELPGTEAPTSDINFPMALALIVFFSTQIIGMKENHGIKYFKHLFKPVAIVFPLMVIEEFVRPLSLTFRLYGNVFGEETVAHTFFNLVPLGVPIVMQALSVLMGLIQALVFSLLAGMYIGEAVESEDHL